MLQIGAIAVTEVARLQAILLGLQDAATTVLASKTAWPEGVALSISTQPVVVYPTAYEVVKALGGGLTTRGVLISGVLVQRGYSAGLLGEQRMDQLARAIYAALVLDTIDLTQIGIDPVIDGPDADVSVKRGRFDTAGGNNGTELVFVAEWTLRMVLRTATLLNDPDDT